MFYTAAYHATYFLTGSIHFAKVTLLCLYVCSCLFAPFPFLWLHLSWELSPSFVLVFVEVETVVLALCTYSFSFKSPKLVCKHILALHSVRKVPLYRLSLWLSFWTHTLKSPTLSTALPFCCCSFFLPSYKRCITVLPLIQLYKIVLVFA